MENKTIDVLSLEDMIRDKINFWRSQLLDRYVSLQEGMKVRRDQPTAKVETQIGLIPISEVCKIRRNAYLEARHNLKALEELLKKGEEGASKTLLDSDVPEIMQVIPGLDMGGPGTGGLRKG